MTCAAETPSASASRRSGMPMAAAGSAIIRASWPPPMHRRRWGPRGATGWTRGRPYRFELRSVLSITARRGDILGHARSRSGTSLSDSEHYPEWIARHGCRHRHRRACRPGVDLRRGEPRHRAVEGEDPLAGDRRTTTSTGWCTPCQRDLLDDPRGATVVTSLDGAERRRPRGRPLSLRWHSPLWGRSAWSVREGDDARRSGGTTSRRSARTLMRLDLGAGRP